MTKRICNSVNSIKSVQSKILLFGKDLLPIVQLIVERNPKQTLLKLYVILTPISSRSLPQTYFAKSVGQDQAAHTCSLI